MGQALWYGQKASKLSSRLFFFLVGLGSLLATIIPLIFVVVPKYLEWAALPVPIKLRWLGTGPGLLSIP